MGVLGWVEGFVEVMHMPSSASLNRLVGFGVMLVNMFEKSLLAIASVDSFLSR